MRLGRLFDHRRNRLTAFALTIIGGVIAIVALITAGHFVGSVVAAGNVIVLLALEKLAFEQRGIADAVQKQSASIHLELQDEDTPLREGTESIEQGLWRAPGHYYSPIPDLDEVERDRERIWSSERRDHLGGIDLALDHQVEVLSELSRYHDDFPEYGPDPIEGFRFVTENRMYGLGDAGLLYAFIRHCRPNRIVEVGSGYSSAVALDTAEHFLERSPEMTFIEPYPERLLGLLSETDRDTTELRVQRLQDTDVAVFECLEADDILIIDSSHVAKTGSDVVDLYSRIMPVLAPGVLIHIHDIAFPFEYPPRWVEEGRAWNEAYMLSAFLQYNSEFKIELWNSCLGARRDPSVYDRCPRFRGGSQIWIRRR